MPTILESSHQEFRSFVVDATGIQHVLPVIVTEHGVLDQLARYMHLNHRKSRSWQEASVFAVRLLLEFMEANHGFYDEPRALFTAFSDALFTGTVSNIGDPSGLWWQPRQPDDAGKLIGLITKFTDWLAIVNEDAKFQLNPWRQATRHEERLNWAAYSHRRDNAFLSHLWRSKPQTSHSRVVRSRALPVERHTPAKAFPEEYFDLLISEGFRRRTRDSRGSTDLRNVLITFLMHYGGLRLSEALSLWSDDVSIEAGEVIVRVHHPEYGLAPGGKTNRTAYLQNKYALQPRNRLVKATDPLFLGWKNGLITDPHRRCFEVFFYPNQVGQVFACMWRDYHLNGQRVKQKAGEEHPYAFTNRDGKPYSHRMFRKAHKQAVERIGLVPEKIEGTTPHGHRHAYGQRLARNGADSLLIKNAMHHASIGSSQTYTQPTTTQMRQSLRDLETRLRLQYMGDPLNPLART
ncbi:TPA: site-specific integrase [Pseudomonas aeruginosa]|uniref:gamma-mobile-trio recombinase GmtY n=1 Tax=Pseudomonas aeruginosa TaxID=287 RepID=UPI0009417718|nr:gamma-mobile-trio recombinase GmtY [Pseudomonas aeruginosa]ARH13356.1 integrase [Pseudomonas aeruginosa]MCS7782456.1 gamma-mobile-trio recombinase GmtY [Pseudomonas aeruginosa]OKS26640.1 integrase [Pseudomonas aeruginosa]RPZ79215.1 integrase [Pseudomonas aeruginosa]RUH19584.1 site-specific integrase [Pseudomonas aeruginosa]